MLIRSKLYLFLIRIFFVSLGAIPASLFRWLIPNDLFVNIIGTLVLGFIAGFGLRNRYKLTIAIGFCGSCTTFSSWIVNIIEYTLQGDLIRAIFVLITVLFIGLLTFSIAFYFGRKTKRSILQQ